MEHDSKSGILAALAELAPLPDDAAVTQSQLDLFRDVVGRIELAPPDPDYVRPLLASFGFGDGYGLYARGADALLKQDRGTLIEAALDTLETGREGPLLWAMETLRRMRERDRGIPSPSAREFQAVEAAISGPELIAQAAVYWAYWIDGNNPVGRQLLELAVRIAPEGAKTTAVDLLRE